MAETSEMRVVGTRQVRKDSVPKATGEAVYTADIKMPGMLHGKALRSAYPHAKIISIDTQKALSMPGVRAVLTAEDVPGVNRFGLSIADQEVLASEKVRMMGDPVALVAAETLEQCEEALKKIEVVYEELPGVFSIEDALKPDAPLVHEDVPGNLLQHTMVRKGDMRGVWERCAHIVENDYSTQRVEHAYIEPEVAIAYVDDHGVLNVLNSTQYTFRDRRQIADAVRMPHNMVRVQQQTTGGAFGGKDDITCEIQASLLAIETGRPVKVVWTRSESMVCSTKRHPMKIHVKTGCDGNGKLLAMEGNIYSDKGAYCSIGHFITKKAGLHLAGPYYIPNVSVDTYCVYTNNTICGPYRGFGILQSAFVHESQMDQLAACMGMDPLEFRLLNCLKHGLSTATGQVFTQGVGFEDTLLAMQQYMAETDLYGEEDGK